MLLLVALLLSYSSSSFFCRLVEKQLWREIIWGVASDGCSVGWVFFQSDLSYRSILISDEVFFLKKIVPDR